MKKCLFLVILLITSCSNRYDGVHASLNADEYIIDAEGDVGFEIQLRAENPIQMPLHTKLSETIFMGVSNNECEAREFDEINRDSETSVVSISSSQSHFLKVTATVKDRGSRGYELDFGELGTICIAKGTSEQIAFAIVPSDYDSIYRGESPIYSRHAHLVAK